MQERCGHCDCRFFAEDEDYSNGSWVCSYCKPKLKKCWGCEMTYLGRFSDTCVEGICEKCRGEGLKAGFANYWMILRFKVLRSDNFACRYCGRSPLQEPSVKLHVDHIHPRSKDGSNTISNLVTACADCNQGKVDILLAESEIIKIKQRRRFHGNDGQRITEKGVDEMALVKGTECDVANHPYVGAGNIQTEPKT